MGQYAEGQRLQGSDGKIYVVRNGVPVSEAPSPLIPNPKLPGELTGQTLSNQRTQQEITQAQATAEANTTKAKAEAQSAQLAAKQAQEQWNINHPQANGTEGLSGPAYMQFLQKSDPGRAAYIQGLAEGRVPFPGGQMMRSPAGQALLTQVMRADPTIDATNYSTRAAGRKNAAVGKLSNSDNALITAIGHASMLNQLVPDVFGTPVHAFNSVANAVDGSMFNGKQPEYDQNARLLGSEVSQAYGQGTGGERDASSGDFSGSLSSKQKQDNIQHAVELMASKLAANRAQFAYGNGQLGKPDFMLLPEQTRNELMAIPGGPDIAAKYFGGIPSLGHGNGPSGPSGGGGAPPVAPTDLSGMVGGPGAAVATTDPNSKLGAFQQTYRNEYDPVMASTLSTFLRKGVPYETAAAFAQSHGFNPPNPQDYTAGVAFAKAHGGATNVDASRTVPTTMGERLASSPLAAGIAGAGSAATAGLDDLAGRSLAGPAWDANRAALSATNPGSDLAGNVLGGAAGMFAAGGAMGNVLRAGAKGGIGRDALALALKNPVKAGALGDVGYGALYGANESPDNPLAGAGIGAISGGLGGLAGAGLTSATGAALKGVTNPAVNRLRAAGIPLTVGETLGGGWKKAQDSMTSVFGPGNMVARRYADGREALNRAAFNEAGNTIGAPINAVGQAGIDQLNTAKNQAYAKALNPIQLDMNTPSFIADKNAAVTAAQNIPNVDQARDLATGSIQNYIGGAINPATGMMAGPDFQQAYRGLSRTANQASDRIYGHEIGQALGQGKDALVSALQAQNPGAFGDFLNANSANRHLNVLANAVNSAKNQIGDNGEPLFTPAQLGNAATANGKTFGGNIAAASGARPFNQLAADSQQVMSSKLPESGTFPRQLMGLAMTGGIAGGGGMFGGQANGAQGAAEGALTPLALMSLLGTRRGQKLLTSSLIDRTAADQYTGRMLLNNSQVGGQVLTATGLPLLFRP